MKACKTFYVGSIPALTSIYQHHEEVDTPVTDRNGKCVVLSTAKYYICDPGRSSQRPNTELCGQCVEADARLYLQGED